MKHDLDFTLRTKELFPLNEPLMFCIKNAEGGNHAMILEFSGFSKVEDFYLAIGKATFATHDGAKYCYTTSFAKVFNSNYNEVGIISLHRNEKLEEKDSKQEILKSDKSDGLLGKIVNYFK